MAARAWTRVETAKALFDATVAWLRSNRVLLPGASVLARLVAAHRDRATEQMHASLHQAATEADPELPDRLTGLLTVPAEMKRRTRRWLSVLVNYLHDLPEHVNRLRALTESTP